METSFPQKQVDGWRGRSEDFLFANYFFGGNKWERNSLTNQKNRPRVNPEWANKLRAKYVANVSENQQELDRPILPLLYATYSLVKSLRIGFSGDRKRTERCAGLQFSDGTSGTF